MTIERLTSYDENDDSDLRFVAATGTPDTLTVRPDTELMVASSTTFAPGWKHHAAVGWKWQWVRWFTASR